MLETLACLKILSQITSSILFLLNFICFWFQWQFGKCIATELRKVIHFLFGPFVCNRTHFVCNRTHLCLEQNLQMKANITNKTLFSTPIIFFSILTFLSRTIQIPSIQEEPRFDNRWHVRPRLRAWRLCCRRLL